MNKLRCHIHAYMKFYNLIDFEYIRECLSWYEGTVNIQRARSRRNVLKLVNAAALGTIHCSVDSMCVSKQWPCAAVFTLNIFSFIYLLHFCLLIACAVVIVLFLVCYRV